MLFFLSPYVAKNNVAIDQTLSILISAKKEIDIRESVADDSGTNVRQVQHWMTRRFNKMDIVSELHDTQMVAALFQLPTELCSESFILVGIHESVAFIKRDKEFLFINEIVDDDNDDDDDDEDMNRSSN